MRTIYVTILILVSAVWCRAEYTIAINEYLTNSGACQADISVTVSGNAGPYNVGFYYLDYPEVAYQTFDNVSSNNTVVYDVPTVVKQLIVRIKDAYGCEHEEIVSYDCGCESTVVNLSDNAITHPLTCADDDVSGSYSKLQQFVYNGNYPLTYDWGDPNVVDNGWSFEGFGHGNYVLTVTDALGCTATDEIEFRAITAPTVENFYIRPSCSDMDNGKLTVWIRGNSSESNLSVQWQENIPGIQESISQAFYSMEADDIPPGEYCVDIRDSGTDCYVQECFVVPEIVDMNDLMYDQEVTDATIVPTCFEESTGSVKVYFKGGNPYSSVIVNNNGSMTPMVGYKYHHTWLDTDELISANFAPRDMMDDGVYTIVAEDYCGNIEEASITIPEYPEIEMKYNASPGCPSSGGTLEIVEVIGGHFVENGASYSLEDYSFSWAELNGNLSTFDGLAEGIYNLTITSNVSGCTEEFKLLMDNYPSLSFSAEVDNICGLSIEDQEAIFGFVHDEFMNYRSGGAKLVPDWDDGEDYSFIDNDGNLVEENYTVSNSNDNLINYAWTDFPFINTNSIDDVNIDDFVEDGFEYRVYYAAENQYGCIVNGFVDIKNDIRLTPSSNDTECGFQVDCFWGGGSDFVNTSYFPDGTNNHRQCCFFETCVDWECKCLYNDAPLNAPFTWFPEYDLNDPGFAPEYEQTFQYDEQFEPNCKIRKTCPQVSFTPCYAPEVSIQPFTVDRNPCDWGISDCSSSSFSFNGDNDAFSTIQNKMPNLPLEFVAFAVFKDGGTCANNIEDFVLCVDLPEAGGDVVVETFDVNLVLSNANSLNPAFFDGQDVCTTRTFPSVMNVSVNDFTEDDFCDFIRCGVTDKIVRVSFANQPPKFFFIKISDLKPRTLGNGQMCLQDIDCFLAFEESVVRSSRNKAEIEVSPNPFYDILNYEILNSNEEDIWEFRVLSIDGSELIKGELNNAQGTIDLHFIPNGMYIISFESNNNVEQVRIIKS